MYARLDAQVGLLDAPAAHNGLQKRTGMKIDRIQHVAYRCRDVRKTVLWYEKHLNMQFLLAISEDEVPSTKAPDPYMHVFLDAGMGNVLAFFDLPTQPEMSRNPNTPNWVQHIAFRVQDRATLLQFKDHLQKNGVEVLGITDPWSIPLDLFRRSERPSARAGLPGSQGGRNQRASRPRQVADAGRKVADETRPEACCFFLHRRELL